MIEVTGDAWIHHPHTHICVLTNTRGVCGAGIALQAKNKCPGFQTQLQTFLRTYGPRLFIHHKYKLISFPTKHHWRDPSDLTLIQTSAEQLIGVLDKFQINNVFLPRPGCGLGRLNWEQVKPILQPILDDRISIITKH